MSTAANQKRSKFEAMALIASKGGTVPPFGG